MTTEIDAVMEIDHDRGVIYVHNKATGTTILRICGLKFPSHWKEQLVDITRPERVSYI